MFEPVPIVFAISVVTHDLGQAQRTEHGAHPLHASADRAGNLLGFNSLFSSSLTTVNATGLPSRRHRRDCL